MKEREGGTERDREKVRACSKRSSFSQSACLIIILIFINFFDFIDIRIFSFEV